MKKELEIKKENGYRIAAEAFVPGDGGGEYPTVIFSHGLDSNYRELEHYAPYFEEAGIASIFFDFCGGSLDTKSEGSMEEMTVLTEAEDLRCVLDEAKKYDFVDTDRIYLAGESMGGFVTAYVAALLPEEIKALVLWYPAFIIPEDSRARFQVGMKSFGGLPLSPDFNKVAMGIDIYNMISAYKRPVKIIHGDMDQIVPISYSKKAIEYFEDVSLTVIKGAEHGFIRLGSEQAIEETVSFIKKTEQ